MRFAIVALLAAAVGRADDPKDELSKLEGKWEVVTVVGAGKDLPRDKGPQALTIKAGTLTGLGPEVKLATDATKKPKWLNMTFSREGTSVSVNAIYDLDGDTLRICLPAAPGKGSGKPFENKRPEGFDTKDKPEVMMQLKRAK
ncbi:MAG TPA: TIGR03067 domain-containing protein [Gemmataceae bacterium]|jgi:uncharacterized protein (TIGR03067 family)|nr:TIGR03067 domain-containing protein [Gemmataceae bacterium]